VGAGSWPDRLLRGKRDKYEAAETTAFLEGVVDGRKLRVKYRQIFVWSEAKARQEAETRERHVSKIREEFEAVERNLNKYSLTTQEKVLGRLESAKAKYSEGSLFEYELTKDRKGLLHLRWKINAGKLQRRKQLEGVYVLKTDDGLKNGIRIGQFVGCASCSEGTGGEVRL
jgi:hypothetical protein